jgi:hypothetical protein
VRRTNNTDAPLLKTNARRESIFVVLATMVPVVTGLSAALEAADDDDRPE